MARIPFNAEQHPHPSRLDAIDSIRIHPRSYGVLNAGQHSLKTKPSIQVHILSDQVGNRGVDYKEVMLGSPEKFTLTYRIENRTDAIAFAYITKENGDRAAGAKHEEVKK
ncbi:MAG: hypothetical protein WCT08_03680 [Patescibacteria group bacterium]|jgi:hypothetical protein